MSDVAQRVDGRAQLRGRARDGVEFVVGVAGCCVEPDRRIDLKATQPASGERLERDLGAVVVERGALGHGGAGESGEPLVAIDAEATLEDLVGHGVVGDAAAEAVDSDTLAARRAADADEALAGDRLDPLWPPWCQICRGLKPAVL